MMRKTTTRLAVTALVTGALLGTPMPAATAAAETCQGRPATIVGTGPNIQGTPGDDVIVTGASRFTLADAGNDLVCVSPFPHQESVYVDAGPGDDVVDASASTATSPNGPETIANLRTGLDRYIGGPSRDDVHADGADDNVIGAESAHLDVTEPMTGTPGTYTGDLIVVWSADQDVEIDLAGHLMLGGVLAADIADFKSAHAVAPRAVIRGDAEDNLLTASGCDVDIIGKGGDDYLSGAAGEGAPRFGCASEATMRGGSGDDFIKGWLGQNLLIGNSGNDELHGRPQADFLRGGSGDDDIFGGAGSDVLRGNGGNDTLTGNPGRDTADGDQGRDRCRAERERRCER